MWKIQYEFWSVNAAGQTFRVIKRSMLTQISRKWDAVKPQKVLYTTSVLCIVSDIMCNIRTSAPGMSNI